VTGAEKKATLVIGMGRSGRAAAELLAREGETVVAYDRDPEKLRALPRGVTGVQGAAPPDFDAFERVIGSPGVALAAHAKLVPEVDLAAERLLAELIGVTGTNGKSTTTALIGEMLRESGFATEVGGNLGTPLCALVGRPARFVVAELSSFQLEHARRLHARVAVLLNLTPDHLDRHASLAEYGRAKERLVELQTAEDVLVFNRDDPWAREVARRAPARRVPFSARESLHEGASFSDGELRVREADVVRVRVPVEELAASLGTVLRANSLAASAAALAAGAMPDAIALVLGRFRGLPHRAEPVCERRGVEYVNDSMATNPARTAATLRALSRPTWWLAGGRNKGLDFAPLRETLGQVRGAIFYGESGEELLATLGDLVRSERVATLDEAVARAAACARPGEGVLLAPACASFDQFRDFEERGERFAALARELPC
jgi:UDP-N-acetylmuramoylalanine--D-glutamate ligase